MFQLPIATPFALPIERTLAVCREQGLGPAPRREQVVVLGIAGTDAAAAAAVARRLRDAGITAVLDASDRRLDRRLAAASRQGARAAVLVGADEAATDTATWKDLDTGHQETAPVAVVAASLRLLLTGK